MTNVKRVPVAVYFLFVCVALFAHELWTKGYVMHPVSFVNGRAPFSIDAKPVPFSRRRLQGDVGQEVVPWQIHNRNEWRSLRVPLWTQSGLSGKVMASNDVSATYAPGSLLAVLFPRSAQLTVMSLFKLLVAGVSMVLLLRHWGLSPPAQAAGAVAYTFSFMMMFWLGWPQANPASMLPLFVLGVEKILDEPTRRNGVLFGVAMAFGYLGGHGEILGQLAFGVAVLLGLRFLLREDRRGGRVVPVFGWALAGIFLGMALAAFHVVPFLDTLRDADVWEARERIVGGYKPIDLRLAVAPDALGYGDWLRRPDATPPGPPFTDAAIAAMGERNPYVGLSALALVPLAFLARSRRRLALALAAFGVLFTLAYYGLGLATALSFVPVVGRAHPDRGIFLIAFALSALAAIGADALAGDDPEFRKRKLQLALAGAIGFSLLSAIVLTLTPAPFPFARGWAPIAGALAIGAVALTLAKSKQEGLRWLVPATIAAELLFVGRGTWEWTKPANVFPDAPMKPLLAKSGGLLSAYDGVYPPEFSSAYGLRDVRAWDPTISRRWRRLFDEWDPGIAPYRSDQPMMLFNLLPHGGWSRIVGIDRYLVGVAPSPSAGWIPSNELKGTPAQEAGTRFEQRLSCTEGVGHMIELVVPPARFKVSLRRGDEEIPNKAMRIGRDRVLLLFERSAVCPADVDVIITADQPVSLIALPPPAGGTPLTADGEPRKSALAARIWSHAFLGDRAEWWGGLVILHDRNARPEAWLADRVVPSLGLEESLGAIGANVADSSPWAVIEGAPASSRVPLEPGESVTLKRFAPGRIEVRATTKQKRWLVVNESWNRGWRVHADGARVKPLVANAVFQAFELAPGEHVITLRYLPGSFLAGLAVSMLAIAITLWVLFEGRRSPGRSAA